MIYVKDVTDLEYREEVRAMYENYYEEILGKDWVSKIPFKKIRDLLASKSVDARYATDKIYGSEKKPKLKERMALGLFSNEALIGFACIQVFNDNIGGIYHIYIKPEYRKSFTESFEDQKPAVSYLKESIDEYFKSRDVNSAVMEVPHAVSHLTNSALREGFTPVKVYEDAVEFEKPLK